MEVSLHPAARAELHEAADWHALEAGRSTASKFITDFEQAQARILDNQKNGGRRTRQGSKNSVQQLPLLPDLSSGWPADS